MKKLTIDQLVEVHGGDSDIVGFVDGFCAGVGIAALFTGIGTPLAVGCGGWTVMRLF